MKKVLMAGAVFLLLVGCGDRIEPGRTEGQQAVVKGLQTAVVNGSAAPADRTLSGTIVSSDRAELAARIPGQVAQALVKEGDFVRQGQPLLELNQETVTTELGAARAAVAAAQSRVAESRQNAELSAKTLSRYSRLYEKGAVTAFEYDQLVTANMTAHQRLATAEAAFAENLARQEGALTQAELATLKAPFDATVVAILADAGTTVHPGTPLISLDRAGPWQVRVALPEKAAGRYRIGDEFPVEIPALAGKTVATLVEIQPAADPQTRTVKAKLALTGLEGLRGGLYAQVSLPPDQAGEAGLMVPASAIVVRGQLTSVYVVEDQTLHYRLVRTGATRNGQVDILSGLQPGEVIVVSGLDRARHGARLESPQ